MISSLNNPADPATYFVVPACAALALNTCKDSWMGRAGLALAVAEMGRRLYVVSQHGKVLGENWAQKSLRVLGSLSGAAVVALGIYACVSEASTEFGRERDPVYGPGIPTEEEKIPTEEEKREAELPLSNEYWRARVPASSRNIDGTERASCDALQILESLQGSPYRPPNICFERARLPETVWGGVGTARALDFVNKTLRQCSKTEIPIEACVTQIAAVYGEGVTQELRDRQSAWHAIATKNPDDPCKDKMQAMLNMHDLEIVEEFPRGAEPKSHVRLEHAVRAIFLESKATEEPLEGWLIRGYHPAEKSRAGEWWVGKTVAVLKFEGRVAYFNSNQGLFIGPSDKWSDEMIARELKTDIESAGFDQYTIPTHFRAFTVRPRREECSAL